MCMFVLYVRGKSVYEGASSAKYKKGDSVKMRPAIYSDLTASDLTAATIEDVDTRYSMPLYKVSYMSGNIKIYVRNLHEGLINDSFTTIKTFYFLRNNKYQAATFSVISVSLYYDRPWWVRLKIGNTTYPTSDDTKNPAFEYGADNYLNISILYRTNQLKHTPGPMFSKGDKVFATEKDGDIYYPATIVGVDSTKEDIYSITFDNDETKKTYNNISVTNLAIGSDLNGANHDEILNYCSFAKDIDDYSVYSSTILAKASGMNMLNAFKSIFPDPNQMAATLIGPTGPTGNSVLSGNIGKQGIDGTKGDIGIKGIPGLKGLIGLTGPIGNTGIDGAAGNDAGDGVTGPTGPIGPTGESIIGAPGPMGDTGPKGPDGDIGPLGPINTNYILSNTGPTGPTGPTGKDGDKGNKGPIGKTGLTGTSYILSGTTSSGTTSSGTTSSGTTSSGTTSSGTTSSGTTSSGTTRTGLTRPTTTASGSTERSNGKMNEIMNTFQTLYQNFKFLTNQQ